MAWREGVKEIRQNKTFGNKRVSHATRRVVIETR